MCLFNFGFYTILLVKIVKESESVFEDVVEDFTSIKQIVNRFEQWKFAFSDSYKEAFLGLCLPKLFTPFIKLQLLDWNPLEVKKMFRSS